MILSKQGILIVDSKWFRSIKNSIVSFYSILIRLQHVTRMESVFRHHYNQVFGELS